jgi:16S rRNA (uracil1498-N3)-methyltransferase
LNLFYQPGLKEGINSLDGDEEHHLRVLRLSHGDEILVTDGKGLIAKAKLTDKSSFTILEQSIHSRAHSIHLFVAPTKNADRIEWLVEKATEIGVASVTLMQCERNERKQINHDRLVRNAISAMKQSQQPWLPQIHPLTSFGEIIKSKFDQNFIAYVDHTNPNHLKDLAKPRKSYGILIGPEGDFTENEMQLASGWQKVNLGPTRLRTETAALVGVVTLQLINLES